ncbi:hypothetical protein CDAR_58801 [Caerostris darwini]|uniref:Uncharacterized protein n=1 Tax=Caerostris darwini TaxID=1538125 RepID=A0AAV4S111_9ARAC|nr:hypothetical protein CDAR_58801 [Caerostris darwini]
MPRRPVSMAKGDLETTLSESKPAECPTTFEEREKRLQKEHSCVENLNQERTSPSDTSFLVKRRRICPECLTSSSVPTAVM